MRKVNGEKAIAALKANTYAHWDRSGSSKARSPHPEDASRRVHDGIARLRPRYGGPKLERADPVFTMGSCFAREIEAWLKMAGGHVCSVDDSIERPEFRDASGKVRPGFFHRFTPWSMLQEFQQAFGELPGWSADSLILETGHGRAVDLNYAKIDDADYSLPAVRTRREVAAQLVRSAARARVVVLTLGLIEAWFHRPSGFYVNAPDLKTLLRHSSDFQLRVMEVQDVVECLEGIFDLLTRRHETGEFELVVTVSPVPLSATFTPNDVVQANAESKAVLRAAAAAFSVRRPRVHYFPSYEMVTYSEPAAAWREDRLHVHGRAVKQIVRTFIETYYAPGAFGRDPFAAHRAEAQGAVAAA